MMYIPNYLCDLHCHTTMSDGLDTPKELIDRAAGFNMKVVAITDHDITPPKSIVIDNTETSIVKYAMQQGLILMRGIEFSCDTSTEDVHIIAFGCDFDDERFYELEERISLSKIHAYKLLVDRLNKAGMKITWEEILNNNNNPIDQMSVQKKLIFQLVADKGYTKTWKDAKLMTQKEDRFMVSREKPEPQEILKLIHDTNGKAILAHPHLINHDKMSRDEYIDMLIDERLDGIEGSYCYSKTNYSGSMSDKKIEEQIIKEYKHRGLFISGGSDYHGEYKKNIKNPREIGYCGINYDDFCRFF